MSVSIVVGDKYMARTLEGHGPLTLVGINLNTNDCVMVSDAGVKLTVPVEAIAFYSRMDEALRSLRRFLDDVSIAGQTSDEDCTRAQQSLAMLERVIGCLMVRE